MKRHPSAKARKALALFEANGINTRKFFYDLPAAQAWVVDKARKEAKYYSKAAAKGDKSQNNAFWKFVTKYE